MVRVDTLSVSVLVEGPEPRTALRAWLQIVKKLQDLELKGPA